MAAVTVPWTTGEPGLFTVDDLDAMPDDGLRRELIDGMLYVTPSPGWAHQEMGLTLYVLLRAACPRDLRVLAAPFGVRTSHVDEVEPDVLVTRYTDLTAKNLPVAPLLVAEVASRSTRLHDRNTKRAHYERLGVGAYWLLDPTGEGRIEVLELDDDGRYRAVAEVTGDEPLEVTRPFPFRVTAAELLAGLHPR